jgi:hypothetical protein
MKVKSSDILKPGAALKVVKIDFSDPKIKAWAAEVRREQEAILKFKVVNYETLRRVITI